MIKPIKYFTQMLKMYSFIDDVKFKNGHYLISYTEKDKQKVKKVSMRSSLTRLQKILINIRNKVKNNEQESRKQVYIT